MKYSKILVHREFRNALKTRAANEDISMLKLTEKLCKDLEYEQKNRKKPKFGFTL